jgi:hypothetical protein
MQARATCNQKERSAIASAACFCGQQVSESFPLGELLARSNQVWGSTTEGARAEGCLAGANHSFWGLAKISPRKNAKNFCMARPCKTSKIFRYLSRGPITRIHIWRELYTSAAD